MDSILNLLQPYERRLYASTHQSNYSDYLIALNEKELMEKLMASAEFAVGDQIIYIPDHANQNPSHPDCERGFIASFNADGNPFCRYWRQDTTPSG